MFYAIVTSTRTGGRLRGRCRCSKCSGISTSVLWAKLLSCLLFSSCTQCTIGDDVSSLGVQANLLSAQRSFVRRVDVVDIGNPHKASKGDPMSIFLFSDSMEVNMYVCTMNMFTCRVSHVATHMYMYMYVIKACYIMGCHSKTCLISEQNCPLYM